MVLWIVIYSFFPSNDFVDEIVVLCGSSLFWMTVGICVLIALGTFLDAVAQFETADLLLGPRFIVKFVTNAYFPRDRDIVREMWVLGDLKDQLGIPHRKGGRRSNRTLEQAPMFHHPHARLESEISSFQHDVELGSGPRKPSSTRSLHRQRSQSWSPQAESHPIEEVPDEDAQPEDYLSPGARARQSASPYSFRASYYSASAIPAPTPLPDIQNPSMSSVSPNLVTPHPQPQTSPSLSAPPAPRSPPSSTPEMYEMHVRAPSDSLHPPQEPHPPRGPSETSYATAYETFDDGEQPDPAWRESSYSSYGGAHAL